MQTTAAEENCKPWECHNCSEEVSGNAYRTSRSSESTSTRKKFSLFDGLNKLLPSKILTQANRPAFQNLPFFHLLEENLEKCEEEYRKIVYHPWSEEDIFKLGIPDDPVQFWSLIKIYEVGNERPFENLATYALHCLTTPVSNVVWEEYFPM